MYIKIYKYIYNFIQNILNLWAHVDVIFKNVQKEFGQFCTISDSFRSFIH